MEMLLKQEHEDRYYVKLSAFEGPFDLLFHLINKEEVDIRNIPLGKITDQYLEYLHSLPQLNTDRAGDFLVMAASLLYLKSRILLPQTSPFLQGKEEEALFFGSKEELVQRLLEYNFYKSVAVKLKNREEQRNKIFLRSPGQPKILMVNTQLNFHGYELGVLQQALLNIKKRKNEKKAEQERIRLPDGISFSKKVRQIVSRLKKCTACFLEDFLLKFEKRELILTFAALLELAKQGRLSLHQKDSSNRIQVSKRV